MSFLEYFRDNVLKIRLVDKDDSWFMKMINVFLLIGNALNITNIKDDPETEADESFMGGYGTTIGRTIYDNPGWEWHKSPSEHVFHEVGHAVQFSVWMAITYVFSAERRMYWESECVQCEMVWNPDRKRDDKWMARRARQFAGYGIPEEVCRRELAARLEEFQEGRLTKTAQVLADAKKAWEDEQAR